MDICIKSKSILLMFLLTIFFLSCTKRITKIEAFPQLYKEKPLSILVLPPINLTTSAEAKEFYATTVVEPLSQTGYYVYSTEVLTDILKSEGLYDNIENLEKVSPAKFKEYFGADAVLYIKILDWDTAYFVIGGNVTVSIDFKLLSTTTGEVLWKYNGTKVLDTSGDSGGGGGLAGCLAILITTAIKTATADYVPLAKKANKEAMISIPFGKYHKKHDTDQNNKDVVEKDIKYKEKNKKK